MRYEAGNCAIVVSIKTAVLFSTDNETDIICQFRHVNIPGGWCVALHAATCKLLPK